MTKYIASERQVQKAKEKTAKTTVTCFKGKTKQVTSFRVS